MKIINMFRFGIPPPEKKQNKKTRFDSFIEIKRAT